MSSAEDYIHFFVLPESAQAYQSFKYSNKKIKSLIMQCDIPYELLKDNFGFGMYTRLEPESEYSFVGNRGMLMMILDTRVRYPFIEVRLNKGQFDNSMISDVSDTVKPEWLNPRIYNRYLKDVVKRKHDVVSPLYCCKNHHNPSRVKANEDFKFLHYFPKSELNKEGNICEDHPDDKPETSTRRGFFGIFKKADTTKQPSLLKK